MTGYSIFEDTLADMTWPAVEQAAQANTPLLVPVAVIEQHSRHLPLATDTYAAYLLCTLIKRGLAEAGIASVIAPPYYFGVNSTTGTFPGSLTVRAETMAKVLTETLENCARWGFRRQFIVNHHGDPVHSSAVLRTIRALRAEGIEATLVLAGQALGWVDATRVRGDDAVLLVPDSEVTAAARTHLTKSKLDVHAAERETSLIMRFFPGTLAPGVDIRGLEPVPETMEQFRDAETVGGWRALSPDGHIGDPAVATPENGRLYELEATDAVAAIAEALRDG